MLARSIMRIPRRRRTCNYKMMSTYYTQNHEWFELTEYNIVKVGITKYASTEIGDIICIDMPYMVGDEIEAHEPICYLESVKAVSDITVPFNCKIVEINDDIELSSDIITRSPEKDGWLFKVEMLDTSVLEKLLTHDKYISFIKTV